jgi:glycosyltransferase involved in cell wall biosynthesis
MNLPRVLFDDHAFSIQQSGGISRLFAEISGAAGPEQGFESLLACRVTRNLHLRHSPNFRGVVLPSWLPFARKPAGLRRLNAPVLRHMMGGAFDIYHQTYYDVAAAERLAGRRPVVVTVHDMIPEKFPQFFADPDSVHAGKAQMCRIADLVICDSETTRDDLIALFGIDPARVTVALCGRDTDLFVREGAKSAVPKLPDNYLLFVGTRGGYKNFKVVLQAFAALADEMPDLHLVAVGRPFRQDRELADLPERHHHRVVALRMSDGELFHAYRGARSFIFPSLYEGFGLPILEAWAAECPLILSDHPVSREVAGGEALYFSPEDPHALAAAVRGVVTDGAWGEDRREGSRLRLQQFTIANTRRRLTEIYQSLMR